MIWYNVQITLDNQYIMKPINQQGPTWKADTATTMFKLLAADCKEGNYSLSGPRKLGLNHSTLTSLFQEMISIDLPGQMMSNSKPSSVNSRKKKRGDEEDWSSQFDSPSNQRKRPSRASTVKRNLESSQLARESIIPELQLQVMEGFENAYSQMETSDDETEDGQWRFANNSTRLPILYSTENFYPPRKENLTIINRRVLLTKGNLFILVI